MRKKQFDEDNETLDPGISLMRTMSDAGMRDSIIDSIDVGLDKLLEGIQDETLSQLPIIKTVYCLSKTGFAVRDYLFLKKIFLFISGFKEVDDQFKKSFDDKSKDKAYRDKVGEELINALNLFDQIGKASLLFKLFSAYVNDEIDYQEFNRYSYALQRIDINNIEVLWKFYHAEGYYSAPNAWLPLTYSVQESIQDVRRNWHLLQGFIPVGLVSLSFGSNSRSPGRSLIPVNSSGRLKCNDFGGKFIRILGLSKLSD